MKTNYWYNISITLFGIIIFTFLISTVGLVLHIPMNVFCILLPIFAGIYYLKKNSETKDDFLKQLLVLLIIMLVSYYISLAFWDYSWDGRSYHSATVILLKNGWLPIYDNISDITQKFVLYPFNTFFSEVYPKFCEIVGANFYKLTGYIESSKTSNFILLFAVFMYSFTIFKEFTEKNTISFIFSLLVCINPICLCELFTNLVDLQLYYAIVFLLMTVLKIEKTKIQTKTDKFVIISSSLMLGAIKLTGIVYLAVVYFCWGIYRLCQKNEVISLIKTLLSVAILVIITCINPYITNFKNYGHPFHPVMGKNKIDVITKEYPRGFGNKNVLERFLISTFAESSNSIENHPIKMLNQPIYLKYPFTIIKSSPLRSFQVADMRVGGFGYYWSGILCLTFVLLFFLRFESKENKKIFLLLLSMILFSSFSNPHAWWARFVPQLWLIPIFTIMFAFFGTKKFEKVRKIISYICIFFIFLNSLIVIKHQIGFNLLFSDYQRHFFNMVEEQSKPKGIYFMRNENYTGKLAEETIIPHLTERSIKIIPVKYDSETAKKFYPLQISPVYEIYYLYRPVSFDKPRNT